MTFTANENRPPRRGCSCDWAMTVLELAIFVAVYRAVQPVAVDMLSDMLGNWFELFVPPDDVTDAVTNMIGRGWLVVVGGRLIAAEEGRRAARMLMNGIIRMLDHGTRLIDVALMMAVLRLTAGELDNGNS